MGENLSWLSSLLTGIFGENRLGRVLQLAFIATILIVAFGIWDSLTGDFTLRRTEKRIGLLADLYDLEQDGITNSQQLGVLYEELAAELERYEPTLVSIPPEIATPNLWQFIGGFGLWVLIGVIITLGRDPNKAVTLVAALIIGLIFGALGAVVPDTNETGTNIVLGFVAQFLFIAALLLLQRRSQKPSKVPATPRS